MSASLDYFNKTTELINNLRDNEMNNILKASDLCAKS
ncbi:uncharacterized protein METZ01_LOCUS255475, partial [marine metagenome]